MADDPKVDPKADKAAADDKPKTKRAPRKKAEPKAAKAEVSTTAKSADDKPKAKRAPRKKAEPKAETSEAPGAKAAADKATTKATGKSKPESASTKKPAPAARRRHGAAPTAAGAHTVRAEAKYVRTSARKARLVCDHIRGKSVDEARAILAFTPRAAARDWAKLLNSAVANAEHNHELLGDDLKVAAAFADEGPTLKRFRPRAMGRATPIHKRTSHLTITLAPKE